MAAPGVASRIQQGWLPQGAPPVLQQLHGMNANERKGAGAAEQVPPWQAHTPHPTGRRG